MATKISKASFAQARALLAFVVANREMDPAAFAEFGTRRVDADETNMLALQLEQMRAKVYEADYAELKSRLMFPIASDIDPAADSFGYEENDHVGKFGRISGTGHATDHKTVESSGTKITKGLESYGGSYIVTMQELMRAAFTGRPLETRKALACRRAWEEKLDEVAAIGDAGSRIGGTGAVNRALGSGASQTQNTAMTTAAWTAGTIDADVMLADLMSSVREYVQASKETLTPTDLALPLREYMLAQHTYFTDVAGGTVLERFRKDNGFVRNIHAWDYLKNTRHGVEATSRGLLWKKDADVAEIVVAQDFTVLPPQIEGYATRVLAHGRTAGFCVYRPLGLRYLSALPAA